MYLIVKCSLQVKRDIQSHAAGLKNIFCKTVDLAMNENIETVDQIAKTEIKQLDTYIDPFVRQSSHITPLQGLQNNKSSFPCILHSIFSESFLSES
jgi:hypothetical protein